MQPFFILLLIAFFCACCARQRGPGETAEVKPEEQTGDPGKPQNSSKTDNVQSGVPATRPTAMRQGPDGEMIPSVLVGVGQGRGANAGAALPKERAGLMRAARDALATGRLDEAVAISDTLVILHPSDPEILELRATVLGRTGDEEQSRNDLARCCELGRRSCCRDTDAGGSAPR